MARKVPRLLSYLEKACPLLFGSVENGKKVSREEMQSLSFQDFTGEAKKKLGQLVVDRAKVHQSKMIQGVVLVGSAVILTRMMEMRKGKKLHDEQVKRQLKLLDELVKRQMKLTVEIEALENDVDNANEKINAVWTELDGFEKEGRAIEEKFAGLDEKELVLEDDLDALMERREVLQKDLAAFKKRLEANREENGALYKRLEAVKMERDAISKEYNSILKTMELLGYTMVDGQSQ